MIDLNSRASEYGRSPCIISKDSSLSEALRAMKKCKTDRVLLKFKDGEINGIATKLDVLSKLATERTRMTEPSSWRISGFMSYPLVTETFDASIRQVVEKMYRNEFTSLPLLGDGEITIFDKYSISELLVDDKTNILEISRTPPVTLKLNDRILHARGLIWEYNISIIPVIGEDNTFLGVIGIDEILYALLEYYEASRNSPKHLTEINRILVSDVVRNRPPIVSAAANVGEAVQMMLKTGYRGVVVVDNSERPIGIVTGMELIKYLKEK